MNIFLTLFKAYLIYLRNWSDRYEGAGNARKADGGTQGQDSLNRNIDDFLH